MKWLAAVVICVASTQAMSAQAVLGVPPARGISFQAPAAPPPPAQPSPVTPIKPAPSSPPPDLFRAGPDTYAPRFDRHVPLPLFPYAIGGYAAYPERVIERTVVLVPTAVQNQAEPQPSRIAAAPAGNAATPEKPLVPGHKRPLYVIPNCYLGDSPPDTDRLPKGCSSSQARQIPRRP